jgi:capsular polysaccharide transport system permease protein
VANFQIGRFGASSRLGLIDHLFILRALILRDLRLKHNHGLGFLVDYLRPIAVIVAHYYFFLVIRKPMPGNVPLEIYCIGGFSVWYAFYYTCYAALAAEKTRMVGALLISGVTPMHLRLAKSAWPLLFYLSFCIFCVIALDLYGDDVGLPNIPLTVLVFLLAGAMGFGLGLLLEALSRFLPIVKSLKFILLWALFITCGIYFSISQIQPILAEIFWYNPLLHLVEYERQALYPGYPTVLVTLLYPAGIAGVLLFLGLAINRCARQLADD